MARPPKRIINLPVSNTISSGDYLVIEKSGGANNYVTTRISFDNFEGTGFAGYTGSTGYVGSAGNNGYTGSEGPRGFTGSTGYSGSQGVPGITVNGFTTITKITQADYNNLSSYDANTLYVVV